MKKNVENIVDTITMIMMRVSSAILILLVILTFVNVVGRKLFNSPISGTIELIEFGMLTCIALAISRTGFEGRHLRITLLHEMMPKKAAAVLTSICQIIAGLLFLLLSGGYIKELPKAVSSGRVTDVLRISYSWVNFLLVFAMVIVTITFFYQAFLAIYTGFFKKEAGDQEKGGE